MSQDLTYRMSGELVRSLQVPVVNRVDGYVSIAITRKIFPRELVQKLNVVEGMVAMKDVLELNWQHYLGGANNVASVQQRVPVFNNETGRRMPVLAL